MSVISLAFSQTRRFAAVLRKVNMWEGSSSACGRLTICTVPPMATWELLGRAMLHADRPTQVLDFPIYQTQTPRSRTLRPSQEIPLALACMSLRREISGGMFTDQVKCGRWPSQAPPRESKPLRKSLCSPVRRIFLLHPTSTFLGVRE